MGKHDSSLTFFRKTLGILPSQLISHEEEVELVRNFQERGCKASLDRLVMYHMKFAFGLAAGSKILTGPSADRDDAIAEGLNALVLAAHRFKLGRVQPDGKPVRFSTYAKQSIINTLLQFGLRNSRTQVFACRSNNSRKSIGLLVELGGYEASDELFARVASNGGVTVDDVRAAHHTLVGDLWLDSQVRGDESPLTFQETIPDRSAPTEDDIIDGIDRRSAIAVMRSGLADVLDDREREILLRRTVDDPETLKQIGRSMGLSHERVRQLQARSIERMKDHMREFAPA